MSTFAAAPAAHRLRLSDLAPGNIQSEIRAMSVACSAANGINMAQGVCDTDVPHPVAAAAIEAIRSGHECIDRSMLDRAHGSLPEHIEAVANAADL